MKTLANREQRKNSLLEGPSVFLGCLFVCFPSWRRLKYIMDALLCHWHLFKANANKPFNSSPFNTNPCRFFFTRKIENFQSEIPSSDPNTIVAPPPPNTPHAELN